MKYCSISSSRRTRKELRLDRKRRWRHASYSVSLEVKDAVADEDSRVLELLKVLGGLGSGAALSLDPTDTSTTGTGRLAGDHASAVDC